MKETFSLEKRGSGKRWKWKKPSSWGVFLSLWFFSPTDSEPSKRIKATPVRAGPWLRAALRTARGQGPTTAWKVGAPRAPRPRRRGEAGKGVFAAIVEKRSWPNLLLYVLCSTSTRAALFTSKILFDKRFPWENKTCNNVNNPILIRTTVNTDRACTLCRHCARKHFHCIDFFLLY